jgi:hypothetical protein
MKLSSSFKDVDKHTWTQYDGLRKYDEHTQFDAHLKTKSRRSWQTDIVLPRRINHCTRSLRILPSGRYIYEPHSKPAMHQDLKQHSSSIRIDVRVAPRQNQTIIILTAQGLDQYDFCRCRRSIKMRSILFIPGQNNFLSMRVIPCMNWMARQAE